MSNIFFTSDTHFSHGNIKKYCKRPFKTIEEMDATMVAKWNKKVGKKDLIYILGDFCWKATPTRVKALCESLNGRKILIFGNHDDKKILSNSGCFEWTGMLFDTKINDTPVTLCHYPMLRWNKAHHGAIHLFGHVHNSAFETFGEENNFVKLNNAMNVGVDVNDFFPVSWDEVLEYVKDKKENRFRCTSCGWKGMFLDYRGSGEDRYAVCPECKHESVRENI